MCVSENDDQTKVPYSSAGSARELVSKKIGIIEAPAIS